MNTSVPILEIIICVPYVRTFLVHVKANQKIGIIQMAFPNLDKKHKLIYWLDGAQLFPDSTFGEVGIHENTVIIVSVQTDNIVFNKYFISMSKFTNKKDVIDNLMQKITKKNDQQCFSNDRIFSKNHTYAQDAQKYFFIQKLKQVFNNYNFSKEVKNDLACESQFLSHDSLPMPILN